MIEEIFEKLHSATLWERIRAKVNLARCYTANLITKFQMRVRFERIGYPPPTAKKNTYQIIRLSKYNEDTLIKVENRIITLKDLGL